MSDIQKVVKVGPYAIEYNADKEKVGFGEGDWVKVNYKRFWKPKVKKSIRDGDEYSETDMECYIPLVTFNNEDYLLIDQGDVEYWWGKDAIK